MKVIYGYGKIKASEARFDPDDPTSEPIWDFFGPDAEVWIVMQWFHFEDGHAVPGNVRYLRPDCSEADARKSMEEMEKMDDITREEALAMLQIYRSSEEDRAFVEDNFPNYQSEPDPNNTDEYDVYHARLKVMGELQPKTVELLRIANATKDPAKRQFVEREAVQSLFAEWAHYLTEDEILAWQRSNPVGTGWMCEFADVRDNPRKQLDPINHELALNWLREKYNQLTSQELRDSVFQRIWKWLAPGFIMTADFIKKRRQMLGLTSKRSPGPRPKSDCQ